ncbi:flagellar basal body rod C-terminal domain-containing protein [Hyphomicrobium sp. LHD-15]|uniref:flagellar basal body rod C-terminal domain-containing protein n=1 Tax=Hyphomicrobium sp. LHD-15 TaxID=3072142 RepID=UPI00280E3E17|nr:flagellar basal body rod C-terminal domain-containing protein [Hyphomicrobium sp. LHD-15]MDQ8697174.1 flagellar basal body rod C-terminal domain-containing protein [Hyphomicrobium sp. LHD-15]
MLPALTTASNALQVQSQRAAEIASAIATMGATPTASAPKNVGGAASTSPVRIGALPIDDPTEAFVSLKEVELAYKLNAAVIKTADEMLGTLLDMLDPADER